MEVFLRVEIPDVPGRLATLAGAIGEAGGDIQAVEVAERREETVVDDLWVETRDLAALVDHLEALGDTKLIHTGPSRGLPGDAVARLATGMDSLLTGAMAPEDALPTLIGGLLFAQTAELVPHGEASTKPNRRRLQLNVVDGVLVLTRDYRFLDAEVDRVRQVVAACERAAAIGQVVAAG